MMHLLDNLLRTLFVNRIDEITSEAQVRFQPPDEDWRNVVKNMTVGGSLVNSLNVYLVDLRENRKLRSNAATREMTGGDLFETGAPRLVDCHYLISAWSPADLTLAIEPTVDEHALLAKAANALADADPLQPVAVYSPAPPPMEIAHLSFPLAILPVEGFIKLAEFWGTMGEKHRWKPVIHVAITMPLATTRALAGPTVTTTITDLHASLAPGSPLPILQIGGTVVNAAVAPATPVSGAWIELLDSVTQARLALTRSDENGRFRFTRLREGAYGLRASAADLGATPIRSVLVPEPGGEYDLAF